MITILGQNINEVRPALQYQCRVYKNERPQAKYKCRAKVVKENSGKVIKVCVKLICGAIRTMPVPATHIQVCENMVVDLNNVIATGWQLDNGNYIWR